MIQLGLISVHFVLTMTSHFRVAGAPNRRSLPPPQRSISASFHSDRCRQQSTDRASQLEPGGNFNSRDGAIGGRAVHAVVPDAAAARGSDAAHVRRRAQPSATNGHASARSVRRARRARVQRKRKRSRAGRQGQATRVMGHIQSRRVLRGVQWTGTVSLSVLFRRRRGDYRSVSDTRYDILSAVRRHENMPVCPLRGLR